MRHSFLPLMAILLILGTPLHAQEENDSAHQSISENSAGSLDNAQPIKIKNIRKKSRSGELGGSLIVRGGRPSAEGTSYSIDILKKGEPAIQGQINDNKRYGEAIPFTVPEPGTYVVHIEDRAGHSIRRDFRMRAEDIVFNIGSGSSLPGETVCVPVTVENFESVTAFQFSMEWDPTVFEFVEIKNIDATISSNILSVNTTSPEEGYITVIWQDGDAVGENLSDGTSIFEVCFEAVGSPGEMTDFNITDDPTAIEAIVGEDSESVPVDVNPGKLNILSPQDLSAEYASCGSFIGESSGSFTITAFGGQPPYDIDWELSSDPSINGSGSIANFGGSVTFTGLPPTTQDARFYDVIITDANGDTFELEVEISHVGPPSLELMIDQIPCPGSNNGRISSSAGGQSGWTLEWSTGSFSPVVTNLSPGVYSATLTDPNGCQVTDTIDLQIDSIDISASVEDASCKGVEDGSVTVTATGGSPFQNGEYTFKLENRPSVTDTAATFSNITAGTYSVTVSDSSNCQYTETIQVGAEQRIVIENLNIDPVSCHGGMDGSIAYSVSMEGGPDNAPYVFSWDPSPVPGTASNISDSATNTELSAGDYGIEVHGVDLNGNPRCTFDTTLTVPEPDSLIVTLTSKRDESCNQGGDGFISVNALGGNPLSTSPFYDFSWSNDSTGITITELTAGDYTVTVTDANDCTDTMTINISQPIPPRITSFDSTSLSCAGAMDGSLTVNYEVGTAPISSITWSPSGSGATISNLSAGQYIVTVTAEDGCFSVDTTTLSQPSPLVFDSLSITDPNCPGQSTGEIIAHVSGSTTPYTYEWSEAGATDEPVLPSLVAETYSLTVTNADECESIDTTVTLNDPPEITASFSNLSATSCFNICDGSATVQGSGGQDNGSFTYSWSSGETGSTANMLCPGFNEVTVSDSECSVVDSVFIQSPDSVNINLIENKPVSCHGLSDGALEVNASGGTGPYDYSWSNSETTPSINNLDADSYTIEVTDDNGCTTTATYNVQQPDSLILEIDSANTFQISCGGFDDGAISLSYTGGNQGAYTFDWSPDVSDDATASELGPGWYEITATDEKGCSDTTSTQLSEPPLIQFNLPTPEEPDCFGEETPLTVDQASGGSGGPYTFTINNTGLTPVGDTIDILAGSYLVSVFDEGGCARDTQITIDQPNPVEVDAGPDTEIALGDSILLQAEATSDFPLKSFSWSPPESVTCDTCFNTYARPFTDQEFTFIATDSNNCTGRDEVMIRVNRTRKFYIPNVFSPNNDGINDYFEVFPGNGVATINSVRLFNRWGNLVYDRRNIAPVPAGTKTWDGTFNGQRLNPGVFIYVIEATFLDGETITFRGDVTLVD